MGTKMKKMVFVFLGVFMMFAITACGGKEEGTEQPSENEKVTSNQTVANQDTESITEVETEMSTEVEGTETESETTENPAGTTGTGGQSGTQTTPSNGTYEDFPYELYVATFDGQYFTFYHDKTHDGYADGRNSINAKVGAIQNSDYGYPGGTSYCGDWENETVTEMGRYKNKSKYITGETMSVVRITVPLKVTLPSAYILPTMGQVEGSQDTYTFYYIEGVSDFNSLKAQADAKAEAYCQEQEALHPDLDYITTSSNTYVNTYQEGKVYQYRVEGVMNYNVQ